MSYFLKDIIAIYPLEDYLEFPLFSKYLISAWVTKLENSNLFVKDDVIAKIKRKYQYNQIGTSDVSQFYDLINELIEENIYEYWMNLIAISEVYSIQNIDTQDQEVIHTVDSTATTLDITNDTPSNKLNIANIKAGTSASNVTYNEDKGSNYTDTTHREATSPLNTNQSNVEIQLKLNGDVQQALNKFINSLATAFSIVCEEYYSEES